MAYGDYLYFSVASSSIGYIMYRTDGTEVGTEKFPAVQDEEYAYNRAAIVFNNRLYFLMGTAATGLELWSTDGTESGTSLVRDIYPGPSNSYAGAQQVAVMNNLLYLTAKSNDHDGYQVWVTNGAAAGTRMIMPDVAPMDNPLISSTEFYVWNEVLYFQAAYTSHGSELWKILPPATGMEEITPAPVEFETWPNPARGELHVNCSHPVTLRLFDFSGRILTEKTFPQSGTLSLAGLAPGLYFIADKDHRTVRKVVVE
jgi:ELWxxDGT repeat protein